jgi:hypothetical protein
VGCGGEGEKRLLPTRKFIERRSGHVVGCYRRPLIVRTTFPVFCSVSTYLAASATSSIG